MTTTMKERVSEYIQQNYTGSQRERLIIALDTFEQELLSEEKKGARLEST